MRLAGEPTEKKYYTSLYEHCSKKRKIVEFISLPPILRSSEIACTFLQLQFLISFSYLDVYLTASSQGTKRIAKYESFAIKVCERKNDDTERGKRVINNGSRRPGRGGLCGSILRNRGCRIQCG